MSFKLLAIRPMKGCARKFLKNLQINCIYKLYDEAKFFNNENLISSFDEVYENAVVTRIEFEESKLIPEDFFYDKKISVSALIGKNGSGKSSLIDLLVASINQLAHAKKSENELSTTAEIILLTGADKICCEIYYKSGKEYFVLIVNEKQVIIKNIITKENIPLSNFFYTNIVNYSIHSNNSNELGGWIDRLFHKNDSYQIPVVINPKRESRENKLAGIIDINNEHFLVIQRLFSLLIENPEYPISDNLTIDFVYLKYKNAKDFIIFDPISTKISKKYSNEKLKKSEFNIYFDDKKGFSFKEKKADVRRYYYGLPMILQKFKILTGIDKIDLGENQYKFDIYIVYKILSICEKYPFFSDIIKASKSKESKNIESASFDFDKFALKYNSTDTHIVVKLKQVVNYFKNHELLWKDILLKKRINLSLLSQQLKMNDVQGISILNKLPPPVVNVDFRSATNVDILSRISSGEKQLVHSISSILYHVTNLNSVEESDGIIKYKNINIILDEIELYFHPEFQRCFLDRLLSGLGFIKTDKILGINILIISHSPFILSDIPKQNVLFLKSEESKSRPAKYNADNTFGENIHEILSNGFFLNDTKGAFAKKKIKEFIDYYFKVINTNIDIPTSFEQLQSEYHSKRSQYVKLVNLIGEDYIRNILKNHLFKLDDLFISKQKLLQEKYKSLNKLQSEIKILEDGKTFISE